MAESNDVKALEKISTEVDEIQFNILLSTQCIKVQSFLVDKLKKQSERQKEVCSFISSANLKLKTEIKLAELEFDSLTSAFQAIKSGNVEYKKDLLLLKERRSEMEQRVKNGINKYENMWVESKKKYENIPLVKKYLEVKNKCQTIQENISTLKNEYETLSAHKTTKIIEIKEFEKRHILQLVDYLTNERPKAIRILLEQENSKKKLNNEMQSILQECPNSNKTITTPENINTAPKNETLSLELKTNVWPDSLNNNESDLLPQIQLQNSDLDILSMKLNEIKKIDNTNINFPKIDFNIKQDVLNKKHKANALSLDENYVSEYFKIREKVNIEADDNEKEKHCSDRKLIHILEDIKLDRKETINVVGQINYDTLQSIDVIKAANEKEKKNMETSQNNPSKVNDGNNSENTEEFELSNKNTPSVVLPPTQFMDLTQDNHLEISNPSSSGCKNKLSQDNKKVQFDIKESHDEKQASENSQINTSTENLHKMKEIILKKHNLDLSPQFVYTKNTYYPKVNKGQPPTIDNITSKFFDDKDIQKERNQETYKSETISEGKVMMGSGNTVSIVEIPNNDKVTEQQEKAMFTKSSSPKDDQDMTVAGLLFVHGPQSIPDSLNLSISTAEYEEGDSEFVHGIDSSLLLSPKPEILTNEENKNETGPEGMNNFLSGLRKTGLSLFGTKPGDSKADTNSNQNNNFTFSFGGDDKRSRGGLFSMFH